MACVAVASLVRTIELELLQPEPRRLVLDNHLISYNRDLIESLHEKLGSLIQQFDEKRFDGIEEIKLLETKLRDLAFRVEDEIEFQVADLYEDKSPGREKLHPCLRLCNILQQATEDIDAINEELVKIKIGYAHGEVDVLPRSDEVILMDDSSQHASHSENSMVRKANELETIKEMLIEHSSKLREVVSIKGMGGIGKTTLAKRVFEDSSIVSHFDKRAWVVASQFHNKRQMLVGLLNSIFQQDNAESSTDEDLALKLYQCLKGHRYLVVIDDVWSGGAWDNVKACFPDDKNCSRVLLTTRLEEVSNYIGFNSDFSYQMHFLDQSASWNLFREKADKSRSVEYEKIGRPVVEKCKGLPLAIVVVAGLFSKFNTLDEWKNIAKALNSSATITIVETCSRILSLSYNHLPHNLKACFLYLGVFPEDEEICAKDLTRLWAAEGLVKASENESLETMAEKNIQELMDRNLILISQRSCCGRKIKRFMIHDLLHAFCVREAQNQNLLCVVGENGSSFSPKHFRWVRIKSSSFKPSRIFSFSKRCRSIFLFDAPISYDLKLQKFNQLRVIYVAIDKFNVDIKIKDLVHLRYLFHSKLHLGNKFERFRAWNLQTLSISDIPYHIWELPQLRYLNSENIPSDPPEFVRQNLQSISMLQDYDSSESFLKNIPHLKKVCVGGFNLDYIKNLACLQQLEKLKIIYDDCPYSTVCNQIVLLENIKKLSLWDLKIEWKEMNVLSKLPRLEVLKLYVACRGQEWELTEDMKFLQLIFLGISSDDLKQWKASGEHFPKLEHLLLRNCHKLKEIPNDFAEISTLKSIKLVCCHPFLVDSAKQIQEEQNEYGNSNMVAIEKDTIGMCGETDFDLQLYGLDELEIDEVKQYVRNRGKMLEDEDLAH